MMLTKIVDMNWSESCICAAFIFVDDQFWP